MSTIYQALSKERKQLQSEGAMPSWITTGGYQLLKQKYLDGKTVNERFREVAACAAKHMPEGTQGKWEEAFYEIISSGWLALSTPVLSNMGTDKGMPVSCSGQAVQDSIDDFYKSTHELAMLTKHGFGTSSYLGNIRPRGSDISIGGKASGVLDVITSCVDVMRKVSQGNSRRGAWAGYLPLDHGDYIEVVDYLEHYPDDLNMGWVVTNEFIERLEADDQDAVYRLQRAMKCKLVTGKGYFFFVDKVNAANPESYKELGLEVLASNLCTEITLPSDEDHTFTCVLSSMNLAKYDEWKDTDAVFVATVFLDCVASEFIRLAKDIPAFSKAVNFTEKSRALGLGTLGFHTYLQGKGVALEDFEAHLLNNQIFKGIKEKANAASEWLGHTLGVPEYCVGLHRRNSHLLAVAPNTSSALICGGVSQGIEPVVANLYNQPTAAGEIYRVNPVFLQLVKDRGMDIEDLVPALVESEGSVQGFDWLTDREKLIFRTAYEIDQRALVRLASTRQRHICQGQSLNLFFDADEDESYIMEIHREAFLDPNIKALYYLRTKAGVQASKDACTACEG